MSRVLDSLGYDQARIVIRLENILENIVEQQGEGEGEGVSVLVEQEAGEEQREEEVCVTTTKMQEVFNSCSLERKSSHMLHLNLLQKTTWLKMRHFQET